MSKKVSQSDRRRSRRTYVTTPGLLARLDGGRIADVVVRDVSATGAQIALAGPVGDLPEDFVLVLSRDGRAQRRCKLAWRRETSIGVRFLGTAQVAIAPVSPAETPAVAPPLTVQESADDLVMLD